ncbi:MAG TPA: S41 family peptidase [Bryobacteraceae bacterium]|nr:S41 family peptidase [Bryobacteraceae bacterium]
MRSFLTGWVGVAKGGTDFSLCPVALFLVAAALYGQSYPPEKQRQIESFEKVWTTIRDKHWQKSPGGLDWQAIHAEFYPRIENAKSDDEALAIMREMLGRLKQTHFGIFPAAVYNDVEGESGGDGSAGIDVRVLDGKAVVTDIDPGSSAERAGVKRGWVVVSANAKPLEPVIEKLRSDPAIHELALERAVRARLTGPVGETIKIAFLDGANSPVTRDLELRPERGQTARFGNLPPMHVFFESKKLGSSGYVRFNMFLDLVRVMGSFADAVEGCMQCDGLIVDLRGNPGGIGGMAMGMAGWLVDKPDQRLGTMYMRDATLNFVINPRADVFQGPVAVLVDGSSASTSEIFAEGLKDLGRARVFGTKTAAAALPSIFERLPNGDGFQYATANYISAGGKPLEGLGVTPDVEVKLSREGLLAGHDAVLDAALEWIRKKK